ncbi:hypothetical protein MMC34_003728 [Xylographa carneopallida]|nr:hypothetical protein [Xylographa carneopallida]
MSNEEDRDGDSQMVSSDSGNESDSMFPSASDPPTPQNHGATNLEHLQSSQLSPPNSQDPFNTNRNVTQEDLMDMSDQQFGGLTSAETGNVRGQGSNEEHKDAEKEPGWAWKNKKAMDEYQRAMDQVLDKNFNLREFGDLFDESTNGSS